VTALRRVLLVGRTDRADGVGVEIARWLADRGVVVEASAEDRENLGLGSDVVTPGSPDGLDLAVSIGGDGTVLRTVSMLDGAAVPVLGVNAGLLGYLAEVEPPQATAALARVAAGDFAIESRLVLEVNVESGGRRSTHRALNEASLEKVTAGHTVRLRTTVGGAPFTTFQADGLIVATPTGSTAYSLSARGPIVSPGLRALLLTPLSPHMLFDRSLVLGPDETVEVEVDGPRAVGLAVDGQPVATLGVGDRVTCSESSHPALFVRLQPVRFHQVLKSKFGLADR